MPKLRLGEEILRTPKKGEITMGAIVFAEKVVDVLKEFSMDEDQSDNARAMAKTHLNLLKERIG